MPQPTPTRDAILAAIKQYGWLSAAELTEELKMSRKSIDDSLRATRKRKLIRVAGWRRNYTTGGRFTPLYGLGANPDAPMPTGETHQIRNARYRERNRAVLRVKDRKAPDPLLDLLR